jgi:membrane protein YdbS with pleckstrin-like domain
MSRPVDAAAAWIYRGVWASVVGLFRVPPEPPTLPAAGEVVRSLRPAHGYLRYLKCLFWVWLIPLDVAPIAAWTISALAMPSLAVALVVPLAILVIVPDVIAYVAIHLRYDTTWYVLTDRSLRIRRGIWVIHETTISFENVQHVEVRQGPLQRVFGIADVIVQTAGGGGGAGAPGSHGGSSSSNTHLGILQGLDDAEVVRDQILEHVRRARSAGLGDEHPAAPAPGHGHAQAWGASPAHMAVLREIRDGIRRVEQTRMP